MRGPRFPIQGCLNIALTPIWHFVTFQIFAEKSFVASPKGFCPSITDGVHRNETFV